MIIDFHTHTFPDNIAAPTLDKLKHLSHTHPFTDGTGSGLEASMSAAGVDYSLVLPVATSVRQVAHINDASAQLNQTGRKLLSLGCMHPDYPDWKHELDRIAALGLKGIKLHPVYQGVDFDDPRCLRILERCGELDLLVVTHAGLDVGYPDKRNVTPAMIRRAVDQTGPVRLVLAHMGGWRCWDEAEQLLADTGVFLDTAFSLGELTPLGDGYYGPADLKLMERETFLRMVRTFGAHRVLFGTDSPWGGQAEELARLRSVGLEADELDAILGGNAQKLLGI